MEIPPAPSGIEKCIHVYARQQQTEKIPTAPINPARRYSGTDPNEDLHNNTRSRIKRVYLNGMPLVLKITPIINGDIQAALRQVHIMKIAGHHENIVTLYNWHYTIHDAIIMEMGVCSASVRQMMLHMARGPLAYDLDAHAAKRIAFCVLRALDHLHSQNIAHCDIKLDNILLVDERDPFSVKVCDFDASRMLPNGEKMASVYQTNAIGLKPPEILLMRPYGNKVDIWALGCCIAEMLGGIESAITWVSPLNPNLVASHQEQLDIVDRLVGPLPTELQHRTPDMAPIDGVVTWPSCAWESIDRFAENFAYVARKDACAFDMLREMLDPIDDRRPSAKTALINQWFGDILSSKPITHPVFDERKALSK